MQPLLPGTLDLLILKAVFPGTSPRLRSAAAHRTDFGRRPVYRTGRLVSGIVPAGAPEPTLERVGASLKTTAARSTTGSRNQAGTGSTRDAGVEPARPAMSAALGTKG